MSPEERRLVDCCKRFLVDYLGDGKVRHPTEFEEELLGTHVIEAVADMLTRRQPPFNRTPFCTALGELVGEGKVRAWRGENDWWCYQLAEVPVNAAPGGLWQGKEN